MERYLQEQLSPESLPEPASLTNQLKRLETLSMTPVELLQAYAPPPPRGNPKSGPQAIKAAQQDVIALARIFTGWGFQHPRQQQPAGFKFYFDPQRHDWEDKVLLGQEIKGNGMAEGEKALDILARHPATARHISYQLAQYFVADEPPPALVERLSKHFVQTDGNIRAVLETLFHSPEFLDPKYYNAKFKTPYQYIVSALRATGMEVANVTPLSRTLQQMGMPIYGCLTPDGYKNTREAWLNPDALTRRLSFATTLARGRLPLGRTADEPAQMDSTPRPGKPVAALPLAAVMGDSFSAQTASAIAASPPQLRAALILGSPEFMHR